MRGKVPKQIWNIRQLDPGVGTPVQFNGSVPGAMVGRFLLFALLWEVSLGVPQRCPAEYPLILSKQNSSSHVISLEFNTRVILADLAEMWAG